MSEPVVIRLPPLAGGQAESWRALIEIAPHLGRHWLLIGGQMVFLHEVERESTDTRPTNDIDLVVDLRIDPTALEHTHTVLAGAGFSQDLPSPEGVAHRYRRGGATIDILAPDHMGTRAKLSLGNGRTIEAPFKPRKMYEQGEMIESELAWFACQRHLDPPEIEAVFPTLKGSIDHALAKLMRHPEPAEATPSK